jgi:hypothetical protein
VVPRQASDDRRWKVWSVRSTFAGFLGMNVFRRSKEWGHGLRSSIHDAKVSVRGRSIVNRRFAGRSEYPSITTASTLTSSYLISGVVTRRQWRLPYLVSDAGVEFTTFPAAHVVSARHCTRNADKEERTGTSSPAENQRGHRTLGCGDGISIVLARPSPRGSAPPP